MNGRQVIVVVITIGSREQKGLVTFRRRLAGLTKKMMSGGPPSPKRALTWYYGEQGPAYLKNASAGFYNGIDDVRPALPGIFEEVLTIPGLIFQINTLNGAISSDVEGAYPHRTSVMWVSLNHTGNRSRTRLFFERR